MCIVYIGYTDTDLTERRISLAGQRSHRVPTVMGSIHRQRRFHAIRIHAYSGRPPRVLCLALSARKRSQSLT